MLTLKQVQGDITCFSISFLPIVIASLLKAGVAIS